jgi:hypothetical protein
VIARSMRGVSLWPRLVQIMEHDTDEHLAVPNFVRRQLRAQAPLTV